MIFLNRDSLLEAWHSSLGRNVRNLLTRNAKLFGHLNPPAAGVRGSEGVASKESESRIKESRNMTVRCFNILNL
jgi:hypothetical protein